MFPKLHDKLTPFTLPSAVDDDDDDASASIALTIQRIQWLSSLKGSTAGPQAPVGVYVCMGQLGISRNGSLLVPRVYSCACVKPLHLVIRHSDYV